MQKNYMKAELNQATNNLMQANSNGTMMYPEVYYRVQPFIMSACDQMDSYGTVNQEMIDLMTEDIYNDISDLHPDLIEYANQNGAIQATSIETQQRDGDYYRDRDWDRDRNYFFPGYRRFRRRGLLRDFISVLLLNELFRRGRIIY